MQDVIQPPEMVWDYYAKDRSVNRKAKKLNCFGKRTLGDRGEGGIELLQDIFIIARETVSNIIGTGVCFLS